MTFNFRGIAAALSVALCLGSAAQAATQLQNRGDFETSPVTTNGLDHQLWIVGLLGGTADRYWQFEAGTDLLSVGETGATLTAIAYQNTDPTNRFQLTMTLSETAGTATPKCVGGGHACDTTGWDFFSIVNATLTGIGGVVDNMMLTLTQKPSDGSMPAQLGVGANDKRVDVFGFSTWFEWYRTDQLADNYGRSGYGDVNLELQPVPLPAGVWLLLAGVGAFGAVRGRKTA